MPSASRKLFPGHEGSTEGEHPSWLWEELRRRCCCGCGQVNIRRARGLIPTKTHVCGGGVERLRKILLGRKGSWRKSLHTWNTHVFAEAAYWVWTAGSSALSWGWVGGGRYIWDQRLGLCFHHSLVLNDEKSLWGVWTRALEWWGFRIIPRISVRKGGWGCWVLTVKRLFELEVLSTWLGWWQWDWKGVTGTGKNFHVKVWGCWNY